MFFGKGKMKQTGKPRVLLLNPPGAQAYSRDKFCTSISQANYGWPPIDLLVFDGQLEQHCEVSVLDAIAQRLNFRNALMRIREENPEFVISLTSAASWPEDFAFLRQVKAHTGAMIMLGGDILLAKGEMVLERYPYLDGIYLNYTTGEVLEWIHNNGDGKFENIISRKDGEIVHGGTVESRTFTYGVAKHEKFPIDRYRFPFCRRSRYSAIITSFGCPFHCQFCVPGTFKLSLRPVEEVMAELEYLARELNIREVLIQDSTLNANRSHASRLFEAMRKSGLNMEWICLSRVDCVNDEILKEMSASGCHTIQFGVESGDEQVRSEIDKGCSSDQYREAFRLCRKHGIRPSGFFIIGLPGETHQSAARTIEFSKELRCSTAVFGLAMPHPITPLGKRAGITGQDLGDWDHYDNFQHIGVQLSDLTGEEILRWRLRAYREFYLRPGYILQRLREIGSLYEFFDTCRNGFHIFQENFLARGLKNQAPTQTEDDIDKPVYRIGVRGKGKTVAIIGGGILGMTAAYRLASAGAKVHLFEKASSLGGLSGVHQVGEGKWIDKHHHFICGTDDYLFNLLKELGCCDWVEWHETSMSYYVQERLAGFTSPMDLLRFPEISVIEKVKFARAVKWLQSQKQWRPLESVPARQWWVERCGENLYNVLWKHLMDCKFADSVQEVPLSWFWARVTRRGSTRKLTSSRERFGKLRGSNRDFLHLWEKTIRASGAEVHLNTCVDGMVVEDGAAKAIVTRDGELSCDQVIGTLSNPELLLFDEHWPDEYAKSLDRIRYQGIVTVVVETDRRVSPDFWINISDESIPVPGIIDMGYLDSTLPGSLLYIPHYVHKDAEYYRSDEESLYQTACNSLEQILPDFKKEFITGFHVFRAPYADPLYALDYSKMLPSHKTPCRNLHLYNTTQIYPITRSMNNSIRFGLLAARRVLDE